MRITIDIKNIIIPALIILFSISCVAQSKQIFPNEDWLISTPEKQRVNSGKMYEALDYLKSKSGSDGNKEVIIIRNGYLIFAGEEINNVHDIWSCTKTFTSTVLGLLVEEGKISLDDYAANHEGLLKEYYPEVTFRHFATMTSGYNAVGENRWNSDSEDWSWTPYDPGKPLFAPGSAYAYWDEAQMMFGRVLTRILGRTMESYLKEKITDNIGMQWKWDTEKGINGIDINNGCTGVKLNAENLARWGWLFLNEGKWKGEKLISKEWIKMATDVQVPSTLPVADTDRKSTVGPGYYGFNWWINGRNLHGELKLPGAPKSCFFASGLNNNKCIVIPEWNMVVVRMGRDGHPEHKDIVYGTFLHKLGEAILH